jgi:hypothetical protein
MSERRMSDREYEAPDPQAQLDQLAAENEELRVQLARQPRRRLWNTMYLMIGASLILDLHQSYVIQGMLNAARRAVLP